MPADVAQLSGEVRRLTEGFKAGNFESAESFRDLASLLFRLTVGATGSAPRLTRRRGTKDPAILGGMSGPQDPLRLNNGHFLKVVMNLWLQDTEHGRRSNNVARQQDGTALRCVPPV